MFTDYLDRVRINGNRHFTFQEAMQELGISENAVKSGMYRLKKAGKIISPLKGLYVIVPPEYQAFGSIPIEELVPVLMKHLSAEYYVGILSAAGFYGATHQKTFTFQIITNYRITHPLTFGQIKINIIHKKKLNNLPVQDFVVRTGYLKVATPELTALDLFEYHNHAGGISHIATILSELVEAIDANKLIILAENINKVCHIQRIGYIVEQIDIMDDRKKHNFIAILIEYLSNIQRPYVSLAPNMPITTHPRCKKWKIIENTDFESDL